MMPAMPSPAHRLAPGFKVDPFLGQVLRFRKDPPGYLCGLAERFGDIVEFRLGRQQMFLLRQPDAVKDVLVTSARKFSKSRGLEMAKDFLGEGLLTSEADFHRRQRRLVQPAFHRDRVHGYGQVMAAYANERREEWRHGQPIVFSDEMMRYTLKVVAKTLFDADVEREAKDVGVALSKLVDFLDRVTNPLAGLLDRLPLPATRRRREASKVLDAIVYRFIADRRQSGEDRGDLLSMLLLAQDDDSSTMSDRQVRDEALTLFLAGHETTALALTWTFVLLARHPEIEARLHDELDAVLGCRPPSVDDVPHLTYCRMVMSEAMRLYPPAWAIGRRAVEDHEIGGYLVPSGAIILMSPFVSHRDSRYFPDPERFDPERFHPDRAKDRPPFAYFPFGGGMRVCIGESFAWMEGVLAIASFAQRWRFKLAEGQDLGVHPAMTLRPRSPIAMVPFERDRAGGGKNRVEGSSR